MSILIAYATATGSIVSVAERIAERLRQSFPTVDCKPVHDIPAASFTSYSAVIICSSVQYYKWLAPARHFVQDNAAVLKTKPVWAFSLGFPATEAERMEQEHLLGDKLREDVPNLQGHRFFYGRWRKQDVTFFAGLFLRFFAPQYLQRWGDERNWEEIEAWADSVAKKLKEERLIPLT
jgi:menaquinone-dependent protoporphyrinogen oxidase